MHVCCVFAVFTLSETYLSGKYKMILHGLYPGRSIVIYGGFYLKLGRSYG